MVKSLVIVFSARRRVPEIVQADPVLAWPALVLATACIRMRVNSLSITSSQRKRVIGSIGRAVVRPVRAIPRLVEGVKLYPVNPDIAKDLRRTAFRSIIK
jgi:hypothetical protein